MDGRTVVQRRRFAVPWALPLLLFVLAVTVRGSGISPGKVLERDGDEISYHDIASNLASGNGYSRTAATGTLYPTAVRGPSYVLFLAACYRVFGSESIAPVFVQVFLDGIACLLVYGIALLLFQRRAIAAAGAFLYAVYPPFITSSREFLTETWINFWLLAGLYLLLRHVRRRSRIPLLGSGLAMGIAILSKPNLLPVPALAIVAIGGLREPRRRGDAAIYLGVVLLLLTPWVVRNSVVFHRFVPGVTQGGFTFWGGTGPADGKTIGGLGNPDTPRYAIEATRGMDELERDRWFYEDGVRIIRQHPGRYALLMLRKIPRLWWNLGYDRPPSKASIALALFNAAAMLLAFLGIRAYRPSRIAIDLLLWMVGYFTLVHVVFFAIFRYAYPVYAYLFSFSGAGVVWIAGRLMQRRAASGRRDREGT